MPWLTYPDGSQSIGRPGLQTPSPSSPDAISGLALWRKADAGTSTTSDGSEVTTWSDQSGNGLNVTGGATTTAVYKPSVLNGKPVLRFDGSDDVMTAASGSTIKHVFVVANYTKAAGFVDFDGLFSGTTSNDANQVLTGQQSQTFFDPNPTVDMTYHKNGTPFAEANMQAPINTFGVLSISAASGWADPMTPRIGQDRNVAGRHWGGDIAEVIAYSSVLSDADRHVVQTYLGTKYGITVA